MKPLFHRQITDRISRIWNPRTIDPRDHSGRYALAGVLLGISAPIGWLIIDLYFFSDPALPVIDQILHSIEGTRERLALFLYMGFGTAMVMGSFSFLIGKAVLQIKLRARNLDLANQEISAQREYFEEKFNELNANLKNFQLINALIQKTVNTQEVMQLAARSLHEILHFDRVNILTCSQDKKSLLLTASLGAGPLPKEPVTLPCDQRSGIIYQSLRDNKPVLVENMAEAPESFRLAPPFSAIPQFRSKSFILCPVTKNNRPIGIIGIDNRTSGRKLGQTDLDTVRLFVDQISTNLTRADLLAAVEVLTSELEKTFFDLLKYRGSFSNVVSSLSEGSSSISTTLSTVTDAADTIRSSVAETSSASTELSYSVGEVSSNISRLNEFVEGSIAAMVEINNTITEVQKSAADAYEMSERVVREADSGAQAVTDNTRGMRQISEAVDQATGLLRLLAEKSQEIDRIVAVINEINQKTNLLSLNAAIIAAQAGERGRSFGVVAEEIRTLSRETTESADAIDDLVKTIQEMTRSVVDSFAATRTMVDAGMNLSNVTDQTLKQIVTSASSAMEMSRGIRKATQEQASSIAYVTRSIEELGDMSGRINLTAGEQSTGISRIAESIEAIKEMAEAMAHATGLHRAKTNDIDKAVDEVGSMSQRIFSELERRRTESRQVLEQLEQLKGMNRP